MRCTWQAWLQLIIWIRIVSKYGFDMAKQAPTFACIKMSAYNLFWYRLKQWKRCSSFAQMRLSRLYAKKKERALNIKWRKNGEDFSFTGCAQWIYSLCLYLVVVQRENAFHKITHTHTVWALNMLPLIHIYGSIRWIKHNF